VFASEIKAFPHAVLKHRYPETPVHGDFTTIQAGDYADIDVLCGGTPCQSFSIAGLRGGMADERGNLALEYLRLADRLRPQWLLWENVPGVLSSNGGRDFGAFLGGLGQLGYGFAYRVLDAQYFGLAQRRKRVFVVGYLGDWRRAAAVLFEPESLRRHPAPRRSAGQRVAAKPAGCAVGGSRYGEDADTADNLVSMCLTSHPGRYDAESQTLIAAPLTGTLCNNGKDAEGKFLIAHTLRAEGHDASEDGTGRGVPLVPIAFMSNASGANFSAAHDHSPTLRIGGDGGNSMAVAYAIQERAGAEGSAGPQGAGFREGVAYTLEARHHAQSAAMVNGNSTPEVNYDLAMPLRANDGSGNRQALQRRSAVRRLTPEECEALQGFPRSFTNVPYRGKPASDGPRYKALGNSMAVPVIAWIGRRIQAQHEEGES
jgi:DNA (cytosine-5)-methyltransferase 1